MSTLSVKNLKEYIEKVAHKQSENLIHSEELYLCLGGGRGGGRFVAEFAFLNTQDKSITRQSKHCGFSIIFLIIQSQSQWSGWSLTNGQGGEDGIVWSGLCQKDSQDDFDSEYTGFDGSPDD